VDETIEQVKIIKVIFMESGEEKVREEELYFIQEYEKFFFLSLILEKGIEHGFINK